MLLPAHRAAAFDDRFGESLEHDRAFNARSRGDVAPLDRVIAAAHVKGKVLDVRLQGKNYLIKVLDESGRVRVVEVGAASVGRVGDDVGAALTRGPGVGTSGPGVGTSGPGGGSSVPGGGVAAGGGGGPGPGRGAGGGSGGRR